VDVDVDVSYSIGVTVTCQQTSLAVDHKSSSILWIHMVKEQY
jgi:hypothetical protein